MLAALDAGQLVNIDGLTNKDLKNYLEQLFMMLPLKKGEKGEGWRKDPNSNCVSISGSVLHRLLSTGAIVQPGDLTSSQQLSARTAPTCLFTILDQHPELVTELVPLLQSIENGQGVQLGGIANKDVRRCLSELFQSLGIRPSSDEDSDDDTAAWAVPKGATGDSVKRYTLFVLPPSFCTL